MTLVRVRATEEVIPKSEFELRLRQNNVGIPLEGLNAEALDHHGADPVLEGAHPVGAAWQTTQRDGVEQINGQWFTKYVLVPETVPEDWLDRRKAARKAEVTALLNTALTGGYTHDFGGQIGPKVLQTRNIEDRTNWLISQASYSAAVAIGAGAVMGANFRTEDNVNITLSYADGYNVLLAMASWGEALYGNSWSLKDQIMAAADEAELDAIDVNTGWGT